MSQTIEAPQAEHAEAPEVLSSESPSHPSIVDLIGLAPSERRERLYGSAEKAPQVHPEAVQPVAEVPSEPEAAIKPPESDEIDDVLATPGLPKNFRFHTDDPKLSTFLKTLKAAQQGNPTVNPVDIAKLVGYDIPTQEQKAPEIPVKDPAPAVSEIESLQQEAEALNAQLAEFDDGLITKEYRDITAAIRKKEAEIAKAESRAERRAEVEAQTAVQSQSTLAAARDADAENVLREWPTANKQSEPLGKEVSAIYHEIIGNENHPLHAQLQSPNLASILLKEAIASKTAEYKGLGFSDAKITAILKGKPQVEAAQSPLAPKALTGTPPVPRTVLVTSTGNQPPPPQPPMSAAEIIEKAKADPQFRRQQLFGKGQPV